MLLFWRIRYLDSHDKKFKNRDLFLDTDTLDKPTKAAVELCYEVNKPMANREMLDFRSFFIEKKYSEPEFAKIVKDCNGLNSIFIHGYFEDEDGKEISDENIASIISGNKKSVLLPVGAKPYEVEYALAEKKSIDIDKIKWSDEELKNLGYFVRDLREMLSCSFYTEGPGELVSSVSSSVELKTSITDEEIAAFITVFRRLYMENEPHNFLKAKEIFVSAIRDNPLCIQIEGDTQQYIGNLNSFPEMIPFIDSQVVFTRKRLIDIFLNTRYAHQPCERRTRQYNKCLDVVGGNNQLLIGIFLRELWTSSIQIRNVGVIIADIFDKFCEIHDISLNLIDSISNEVSGIGVNEKKAERRDRIFQEKAIELATEIWKDNGKPQGGPHQFLQQAREKINKAQLRLKKPDSMID